MIGLFFDFIDEDIVVVRDRVDKVIFLLEFGFDFKKIVIVLLLGNEVLEGGEMGWFNINVMLMFFVEVI